MGQHGRVVAPKNNDNQSYDLDLEGVRCLGAVPGRSRPCLLGKRYVSNGRAFIGSPAARDRSPPGQEPPKHDPLRFCGLVFAFEVIQSTTTLDKFVVLFPHFDSLYRRKGSRSTGHARARFERQCLLLQLSDRQSVRPLRRPNPRCRAKRIQHEIDPVWAPPH